MGMVSLPLGLIEIESSYFQHPTLAGLVPLKAYCFEQFFFVEQMVADGYDHTLTVLKGDASYLGQS